MYDQVTAVSCTAHVSMGNSRLANNLCESPSDYASAQNTVQPCITSGDPLIYRDLSTKRTALLLLIVVRMFPQTKVLSHGA